MSIILLNTFFTDGNDKYEEIIKEINRDSGLADKYIADATKLIDGAETSVKFVEENKPLIDIKREFLTNAINKLNQASELLNKAQDNKNSLSSEQKSKINTQIDRIVKIKKRIDKLNKDKDKEIPVINIPDKQGGFHLPGGNWTIGGFWLLVIGVVVFLIFNHRRGKSSAGESPGSEGGEAGHGGGGGDRGDSPFGDNFNDMFNEQESQGESTGGAGGEPPSEDGEGAGTGVGGGEDPPPGGGRGSNPENHSNTYEPL